MRTRRLLVAASFFATLFVLAVPRPAEGSWSVSVSFFHEQLSPYGRWVVAGSYGDCWVPAGVAAGWSPYVDGEWIWTDYGWTWASYDPWGDIPYHYGTWVWVDPYGWVWVPGTIWAPAWVTWAYSDDYIGWAPVPPSFVLTARGYFGRPIVVSERYYCFVPTRQFVGVNVSTVRVPLQQNATIFTQAAKTTSYTVSGGVVRVAGPPVSKIERVTGRRIERVSIDRAKTKPTTLSAGGVTKARSLPVIAPARERARAINAVAKEQGGKRPEAQAKPQRAAVEKPKPVKQEKSAAATAPRRERVAPAPKKHEPPPPKVATKEELRTRRKPERTTAATHSRPETRHEATAPVKSAEKPKHEKPAAQSERHEETRVAAGTGHRAPAGAAPRREQPPPKHEQPQPAVAPPSAPAQPPPGQVKREQHAPPASPAGQAKGKKKEKEKE